jgi:dephospho-CoA kinase
LLKVGITGGIGSGKTTVSKLFELLGIPVYYADDRAKWLMRNDAVLSKKLSSEFGEAIFENGSLQTKTLAKEVFNNPTALKKLNSLVHPAVFNDFKSWAAEQKNVPFILKEAALIFEAHSDEHLDKVIMVFAPEQLRINRIAERDKTIEEAVRARMKQQLPDEEKVKRSQFVIYNDEKQLVIPQVMKIYAELKSLN